MNDPHVVELEYALAVTNDAFEFAADAPALELVLGDSDCRLDQRRLVARPQVHYATAEEAQDAIRPHLRSWELEYELTTGREVQFLSAGAVMRDRAPAEGQAAFAVSADLQLRSRVEARMTAGSYPEPPSGRFWSTPEVDLLVLRWRDVREGRDRFPAAAYWLVTHLEAVFGRGSPVRAAGALQVSRNVLGRLSNLSSRNDPRQGRKGAGEVSPLTEVELVWLRQVMQVLTLRAVEVLSGAEAAALPLITLKGFVESRTERADAP